MATLSEACSEDHVKSADGAASLRCRHLCTSGGWYITLVSGVFPAGGLCVGGFRGSGVCRDSVIGQQLLCAACGPVAQAGGLDVYVCAGRSDRGRCGWLHACIRVAAATAAAAAGRRRGGRRRR